MQTARERIAELLQVAQPAVAPCIQLTAKARDLRLDVEGAGRVRFPISAEQAAALRALAAPALFGRGEQTLNDTEVRDTWQLPTQLVNAVWNDAFESALLNVRDHFGLPESSRLSTELHSMLVYEPGQFFAAHQDSQKHDDMIGTLVVTLPTEHTGGELVVHHGGESRTHRGTRSTLGLVAFHADRHHEVRPVKTGYRVTLTYNLLVEGFPSIPRSNHPENVDELAACLTEHFTARKPKRYRPAELEDAPIRLVYLLDHEYTQRGLSWSRLKGVDRPRATRLLAAAQQAECYAVLALSEVQETWDVLEQDSYRRRRSFRYGAPDDEPAEGGYELQDLLDSSVTLDHWVDRTGAAEEISLHISESELSASTASVALLPYSSEYEGYMGNYGNTLDRWYRRAAVVLWPAEQDFAVRALASPTRVMDELLALAATSGGLERARTAAATLAPFWDSIEMPVDKDRFFDVTLRVAAALDDASTARMLADRFQAENLRVTQMPALAALTQLYGEDWTVDLLKGWFDARSDRASWLSRAPQLCEGLLATSPASGPAGWVTAGHLLAFCWQSLKASLASAVQLSSPSQRAAQLAKLGQALLGVLHAAALVEAPKLIKDVLKTCRTYGEELHACLAPALRAVAQLPPDTRRDSGFDQLAAQFEKILRTRLARPARAEDDWSIPAPRGCACDLCQKLVGFLTDPSAHVLEWPLAEQRRNHVQGRITAAELPVKHHTRQSGRPYSLVLAKKPQLFDDEREARQSDERDLAWLSEQRKPA